MLNYQLQGVLLTLSECERLMAPLNKLIKHKGNLATTTPNFEATNSTSFLGEVMDEYEMEINDIDELRSKFYDMWEIP